MDGNTQLLKENLTTQDYDKLLALNNPKLNAFIAEAIELARPQSVYVCTDSPDDITYIRELAKTAGEEKPLAIEGHTVHFDGYYDQGRDPANTKYLLPPGLDLGERINSIDKTAGKKEVLEILTNKMVGRQILGGLFLLGPQNSLFSIP